jgi:hypothetical protein
MVIMRIDSALGENDFKTAIMHSGAEGQPFNKSHLRIKYFTVESSIETHNSRGINDLSRHTDKEVFV